MKQPFLYIILFIINVIAKPLELHAQWIDTNGPHAGTVMCFARDNNAIFVGTLNGGIFRSRSDGQNWIRASDGIDQPGIYSLFSDGKNLFAGTCGHDNRIFRSTNEGFLWSAVNTGTNELVVSSFVMAGEDIFAGAWEGIFVSHDHGKHWQSLGRAWTQNPIMSLISIDTILFAGTSGSGIYCSTDLGKSWKPNGRGTKGSNQIMVASNGRQIIAGIRESGLFMGGLFLSTDTGEHWVQSDSGFGSAARNVWSIVFEDSEIFVGTSQGIFLSTNGGTYWTNVSTGMTDSDVRAILVNNRYLFAGTYNGAVWKRPLAEMIPQKH